MKMWKKGAIVGGVWGVLATPIYMIVGFIWWERKAPEIIGKILPFITYLPAKFVMLVYPVIWTPDMVLQSLLNIVGWTIIGSIFGYFYGRWKGK